MQRGFAARSELFPLAGKTREERLFTAKREVLFGIKIGLIPPPYITPGKSVARKLAALRYDPNHLFFGDKLNGNSDSVDTVLPVTAKYTDVLFYQMYGKYEVQKPSLDQWNKKVDMPIINGDSAYTHIKDKMPRPYGPIADSEIQNAEWTLEFFENAFSRPEFVGWHYCGLIDTPLKLVAKESDRQHSGLFDGYGKPYHALKKALSKCATELYNIASN